jgi:hypothetical protein
MSRQSGGSDVTVRCLAGSPGSTFELLLPMRNTLAYLAFIQEMTALREFKSAWHAVYERLSKEGFQAPDDFEPYLIPLGITHPIAALYMMLCYKESCGATTEDIVPRLWCGGNGQCIQLKGVLGGRRHFAVLVMASLRDKLAWMGNQAYAVYKDSLLRNDAYAYHGLVGLAVLEVHMLSDAVGNAFKDELPHATCTLPPVYEASPSHACRTLLDDADDIQRMEDACRARVE